jgi:hypothetical protein
MARNLGATDRLTKALTPEKLDGSDLHNRQQIIPNRSDNSQRVGNYSQPESLIFSRFCEFLTIFLVHM